MNGAQRQVPIAPVLRPTGRNNGLSEGLVLLSRGQITDLEAAERFRILRAQMERRALEAGPQQVVAVTSAVPSEGKSVVSVNLARAFGTDPRGKTLLIDCDLRKPNVHRFFNQMQSPGLSDVLVAGKSIRSVLRSVEPGLDLITAGSPVIDSSRAIEQPGTGLMLEELKKHYQYIVLDCPPALFCSEPLHLSHLASSSLIVARSWRTEKKLVKDAVGLLGKKAIAGIVLNECNDTVSQYGYYGYYGYDRQAIAKAKATRARRPKVRSAEQREKKRSFSFFRRKGPQAAPSAPIKSESAALGKSE
ncbi:MAG: CpsD/CapB family tyrosine-protein kinase [Bdellovibrionales bacterium]|nr:CpsD/CapB family tyrosine-protein kinase [Bdellovibrionales bacterium]